MKKYNNTKEMLEDLMKGIIEDGETIMLIEGEERKGMSSCSFDLNKYT